MLTVITRMRRIGDDERGVAAVWFAIFALFVFFGFTFFVVNLSNTHEHRRHLQLQVDDGALAVGTAFTGCFQDSGVTNKEIAARALAFSGDPYFATPQPGLRVSDYQKLFPTGTPPPGPFNQQVEDATRVRVHLNAGDPATDPISQIGYATSLSDTFDPANGIDFSLGLPCDTKFLDVKATDVGVPTPFGGLVPTAPSNVNVKARARVEIRKVPQLNGMLPIAIPEVDPKCVLALFVNEATGIVVTPVELHYRDADGNQQGCDPSATVRKQPTLQTLNGLPTVVWSQQGAPITVVGATGMVVLTSRTANPTAAAGTPLSTICAPTTVACYAGSSNTSGVAYIQGWVNSTGTIGAPVLHEVNVTNPTGCTDDSAPNFIFNGPCNVGVRAHINFGVAGDPSSAPTNARVWVWSDDPKVGCNAGNHRDDKCELVYSGTAQDVWTTSGAPLTLPDSFGRAKFGIHFKTSGTGGQEADLPIPNGDVAHPYAANDASGPVQYVLLSNTDHPTGGANSMEIGTRSVTIDVGLKPSLQVAGRVFDDAGNVVPPISLRVTNKGSLTQSVDCDIDSYKYPVPYDKLPKDVAELAYGCVTPYRINTTSDCSAYGNGDLPPPTVTPNPAPDCVASKQGTVASLDAGVHARWEGLGNKSDTSKCTQNNWPKKIGDPIPDSGDPRWVILIVTDFSAFSGQGQRNVPVTKFAGFYVTDWDASSQTNRCPGFGNVGNPGAGRDIGELWGYFVTEVPNIPGATPGPDFCDFSEVGICIPTLTE